MSDEHYDQDILKLLQQSLSLGDKPPKNSRSTGVLSSAKFITDNAIDVAISPSGTKAAARQIHGMMRQKQYSTASWSLHELHPKPEGGEATLKFVFVMDLLNFSFWSEKPEKERFSVKYRGKRWTGYWSLVACLQRALDEGMILSPPERDWFQGLCFG